jgi:hypothetical protein
MQFVFMAFWGGGGWGLQPKESPDSVQLDGNCFKEPEQSEIFYICASEFTDNTCPELGDLHGDI